MWMLPYVSTKHDIYRVHGFGTIVFKRFPFNFLTIILLMKWTESQDLHVHCALNLMNLRFYEKFDNKKMMIWKLKRNLMKTMVLPKINNVLPMKFFLSTKWYIPSAINIWKKVLTQAIWGEKNCLVSGTLACTSSKSEVLNKIGI